MSFSFKSADEEVKKLEYVQVFHKVYDFVLCQVVEVETTSQETIAKCKTIGYQDESGKVKQIRIPFDIGVEVLKAEDDFIKKIISLSDEDKGAYLGKLEGRDIKVNLDLNKLLTKHCAVLAKSGAGKSYSVGVLLEEIMEKRIPLLIIDPHGEYRTMKEPAKSDDEALARFDIMPKGFNIKEYGDAKVNPGVIPLKLSKDISNQELVHLMPSKLSGTQLGVLYNALKNSDTLNFNQLLFDLEQEESSAKWNIINVVEYLNNLDIFSDNPTHYNELITTQNASIINLKGTPPEIQEIIVYKLCKDLFEMRKKNKVPPFFLVVEEAHNFCPERSFGESKSSKILRTIASEGRKFGLGLCVVSQRPARVDKSVLSQCTTQIVLKVTNPNDLKAISNSVEGITSEAESEIQNLSIGTALVSGVVDIPLFINVRPRKSKHGGDAIQILDEKNDDMFEEVKKFEKKELLPIIKPRTSVRDIKLMSEDPIKVKVKIIPSFIVSCNDAEGDYNILVDRIDGSIIVDKEKYGLKKLPDITELNPDEIRILKMAFAGKDMSLVEAKTLIEKGYLNKDFSLSDDYIFSKLRNHASYDDMEYINLSFDEKLEPVLSEETLTKKLSKVTNVASMSEVFVVKHEVKPVKSKKK